MKRLEEQERIAASTTTSQYPTDKNYHFTTTTTTTTRLVPIKATESITGNFLVKKFPMVSNFNCKGQLTY